MFPMTVTVQNQSQLQAILAVLANDSGTPEKIAVTSAGATRPVELENAYHPPTKTTLSSVAVVDVERALIDLMRAHSNPAEGRKAAHAVIAKFNVERVSQLDSTQYADVINECHAATASVGAGTDE